MGQLEPLRDGERAHQRQGLYKFNPVDPWLESALVSTLEPDMQYSGFKLCFQMGQLAPLHNGAAQDPPPFMSAAFSAVGAAQVAFSLTHSLKGAWFQPLSLQSVKKRVSGFKPLLAFKCNSYRYSAGAAAVAAGAPRWDCTS
jgi:hypothetical protein